MNTLIYRSKRWLNELDKFIGFLRAKTEKTTVSILICLVAGLIGSLPFFFENAFIFTFISITILFTVILIRSDGGKKLFPPFFAYFAGYYFPVYSFLSELYPYNSYNFTEGQAVFVLIASVVLIPLYHSLLRSVTMLAVKFAPRGILRLIAFPAVWACSEWVLSIGKLAFPWGTTAVSLTGFLPYLQTASIFSEYFISIITAAVCVLFASFIIYKEKRKNYIISALALLCLNTVIGTVLYLVPEQSDETVKTALIQGNISSNEKWDTSKSAYVFDTYTELTLEAAQNGAKIILLPESAIAEKFREDGRVHKAFAQIAQEYGATVILGANIPADGATSNAVIAVLPDGSLSARYDKQHLVPFGEYIPYYEFLGEMFEFIKEINVGGNYYLQGEDSIIISTPEGDYGALVCFDSIFPSYTCSAVSNGAQAICIVTNDSWFNDSIGVYTHLRHAKLRAIESGKYILRAANTGVSAYISPDGSVIESTMPLEKGILYGEIELNNVRTVYTYTGDIVLYFAMIYIVCLILIFTTRRIKNGKNKTSQQRDL